MCFAQSFMNCDSLVKKPIRETTVAAPRTVTVDANTAPAARTATSGATIGAGFDDALRDWEDRTPLHFAARVGQFGPCWARLPPRSHDARERAAAGRCLAGVRGAPRAQGQRQRGRQVRYAPSSVVSGLTSGLA